MNSALPPDDNRHGDGDDALEFDLETYERVRAAVRDVAPQDPLEAERAREAALSTWSRGRRRSRRPAWLSAVAAAAIAVVGVTVILRDDGSDDSTATKVAAPESSRQAESAPPPELDASALSAASADDIDQTIDEVVGWLTQQTPIDAATCPLKGDERSYGSRLWSGVDIEALVDLNARTVRLVDRSSCLELASTVIAPDIALGLAESGR